MSPGQHRGRPARPGGLKSAGPADRSTGYPRPGLDRAVRVGRRDWWSDGAALAIRQLVQTGRGFTSDDLVDLTGEPHEPHLLGSAFAAAQRSGYITSFGAVIGRNGRPRRVWWPVEEVSADAHQARVAEDAPRSA